MQPLANRQRRQTHPLQFELLTSKEDVYQTIFALRKKATKIFGTTSKIFRLFDDACSPLEREDPLIEVKIMGQGLLVKNNNILTVAPNSIIGFGFLLPTNRVAYLALATYPKNIVVNDNKIEVYQEDNAIWSGIIETFANQCNSCVRSCDKCIESHELSCELLQYAEKLGVLGEVKDPSDYWTTRNPQSLVALSNELRCGCSV